jgi:cytoskeletal protein RodZ
MSTLHLVETSRDGLGRWLRRARKARGLTLAAIAAETKIPRPHLEALERGEAVRLPAFYQRAEVKAVARVLGLDEQHAVSRLDAVLPAVEPDPFLPSEPVRRVRSEYVLLAGMVVLVAWMLGWGPFARPAATASTVPSVQPIAATAAQTPQQVNVRLREFPAP